MKKTTKNQGVREIHRSRSAHRSNRRSVRRGILISLCLAVCVIAGVCLTSMANEKVSLTLKVNGATMAQGEAVPEFTATASCEKDQENLLLNRQSHYTVKDLLEELNQGKGYTISCQGDGTKVGTYLMDLELSEKLRQRMEKEWHNKVSISIVGNYLTVQDPTGDWKGNRFRRRDGSYVQNDFLTYRDKTYYFNADGVSVTGWQEINGQRYHFNEAGELEKATWIQEDAHTYYVAENGVMMTGWMENPDVTYYFGEDGIMQTGTQQIGSLKCEFAEDGKLISKETQISPDQPMIALTFDDGPGERTHELLDVLEKYHAHATFFMQGKNVQKYSDQIQRMKDLGCEIGNHSYNHPQLTKESDFGKSQVSQTNQLLQQACGQSATVLRPPYGAVNASVKAAVGMPLILWNIDTLDWKTRNTQSTIDSVLNTLQDGNIVLMHDIHSPTVDAAIQLIPKLTEMGYQLVTVSEMAEAKGSPLQNGVVYTDFVTP